jgi:very-short-patch-repair endonuclease
MPKQKTDKYRILTDAVAEGAHCECQAEYRFDPSRKWRLDLAWASVRVAVEIDGGIFVQGRHTRGDGWLKDAEKRNHAQLCGWIVLVYTPAQIALPDTVADVIRAIVVQRRRMKPVEYGDGPVLATDPDANRLAGEVAGETF